MMTAELLAADGERRVPSRPTDFVFNVAGTQQQIEGFWRLRREVFCDEQGLFRGSDRDEVDDLMTPIVCQSLLLGMSDEVVGCVRLFETQPRVWWGGRLGVDRRYRHLDKISPAVAARAHFPSDWTNRSIGAGLVFKAVTLACSRGCDAFFAHVQISNVAFFEHLGWHVIGTLDLRGLEHATMRAELRHYRSLGKGQ